MNALSPQLYMTVAQGMSFLSLMTDLAGCALCLSYWRLSSKLIIAAIAFAGLAVSLGLNMLSPLLIRIVGQNIDYYYYLIMIVAFAVGLFSRVLLVFGLGWAFVEIRRKLALALEPRNGFR